jgi:aryl-alcohol dehydrogenase-like predicted oxidoreductase
VQSVDASLKRLKTDRIDLYFAHMDDFVTPMEEIARGLNDLARAGKIIYGGLSNFPACRVATAANTADLRGWTPISA